MMRVIIFVLLLLASTVAHAQSGVVQMPGCPPGVMPGQPSCGGSSGNFVSSERWRDSYAAFAFDKATGMVGSAKGFPSKRAALNAAISDCGRSGCQVGVWVRNSCLAVVWGQAMWFETGDDDLVAETKAIKNCNDSGESGCKVFYSACSLPVRIQ